MHVFPVMSRIEGVPALLSTTTSSRLTFETGRRYHLILLINANARNIGGMRPVGIDLCAFVRKNVNHAMLGSQCLGISIELVCPIRSSQ